MHGSRGVMEREAREQSACHGKQEEEEAEEREARELLPQNIEV